MKQKPDDDREFQRKVVLGASAPVKSGARAFLRGTAFLILLIIVIYLAARFGHL
jgi:hypothetical protein